MEMLLFVGFFLAIYVWVRTAMKRNSPKAQASRSQPTIKDIEKFAENFLALPMDFDAADELDVVGESHYQPQLRLFHEYMVKKGLEYCRAVMVLEPENRYDKNAVRVDISDMPVGYIPRSEAVWVSEAMRNKRLNTLAVNASIGGNKYLGVRLFMPPDTLEL